MIHRKIEIVARILAVVAMVTLGLTSDANDQAKEDANKGPLVIVGGGVIPAEAREAFVELAGGAKARIVVVPTASSSADNPKEDEAYLKPWRARKPTSVLLLHTRDREKANNADFVKPLADATGVWFSGGDQSRLTKAYRGTLFEKELRKLQARGGVIGGTSAGAAVMSDPMITGGQERATTAPGFGLLPGFVIDQHFLTRERQKRLSGVVAANPGAVGLGIDEGTAAIVRGETVRVVGSSTVTVVLAAGAGMAERTQSVKAGESLDLKRLRREAAERARKPRPQ
jgi:cyanophycinase